MLAHVSPDRISSQVMMNKVIFDKAKYSENVGKLVKPEQTVFNYDKQAGRRRCNEVYIKMATDG